MSNNIETLIQDGKDGKVENIDLIRGLWGATLYLIGRNGTEEGMFEPVALGSPSTGEKLLVAFTDQDKIPAEFRETAPVALKLTGENIFRSVPESFGLVINPDAEPTVEFNGPGIVRIIAVMDGNATITPTETDI